jgi:5'-phosphate synthase pdxT subunit
LAEKIRVAVLALQGDFEKHIQVLTGLGADARAARLPADIKQADAIILPGGESTTIGKLMQRYGLDTEIKAAATAGKPIYGTCAGLIMLATEIESDTAERGGQPTLGLLDITVARNAFGRQVDSFETDLSVPAIGDEPVHAVFIRAPIVTRAGAGVDVLATHHDDIVFVQQGNLLGTSFHPELGDDDRVHRYFLSLVRGN